MRRHLTSVVKLLLISVTGCSSSTHSDGKDAEGSRDDIDNCPSLINSGVLYFNADDGIHGTELWAYDSACLQ